MSSEPEHNRPLSLAAIEAAVAEMLEGGECSIADEHGGKVYKLRPTKIGQRKNKSATIEQINQSIERSGLELDEKQGKRIYRKRKDLPVPEAGPRAEVNIITQKLTPRVSKEHVDMFNRIADNFPNKRAALERAIELLAAETEVDPSP